MKNKVLFISRYSNSNFETNNINFSVNRKVEGILTCFRALNFKTYIYSTSIFNVKRNRNTNFEFNNNIVLNNNFTIFNIRILDYIFGILINTYHLYKLKNEFKYIIVWNYMPDTILPVYFNKICKKKIIIDIEERINVDPEASLLFKLFDNIFYKKFKSNLYFTSNESIQVPLNRTKLIIKGFFSTNLEEENDTFLKFNNQIIINSKLKIFFGGRFDKNRGIELMIELIQSDINYKYEYIICGFGNEYYINKLTNLANKFPNLKLYINCQRNIFIKELMDSDIQLNLLQNKDFAINSFPSKLIELLCLGKLIVTNVNLNDSNKSIIICNYNVNSIKEIFDSIYQNYSIYQESILKRRKFYISNFSFASQKIKFKNYLEIN